MKTRTHFVLNFFLFFVLTVTVTSAQIPIFDTQHYTEQEQQDLADGKVVIRNIDKAKNISLNPIHPIAERAIETMTKLKPAYLAEIIQIFRLNINKLLKSLSSQNLQLVHKQLQ